MSATNLQLLWGRDGDYLLTGETEQPEGAQPAVPEIDPRLVEDLLRELVEAYPGNLDILQATMQRTSAAVDSDPVQTATWRISAGVARLWCFPHPRLRVPTDAREIPRLADLAELQSSNEVTTWIGVRAVDQNGRALPWMRARVGLPNGRISEKRLDSEAHTDVDLLPQSGLCWVELQAADSSKGTGAFVDAAEPPRHAVTDADWIGIRVRDQYGRPLPWMQVRLTSVDGSERTPVLDSDAMVRVDAVPGGGCSLTLQSSSRQGSPPA